MQRPVIAFVLLVATGACGGSPPGQSTHDDDATEDSDCPRDTCGVCNGDGTSCVPQADIVLLLDVEGATLGTFPFIRGLGNASELVDTQATVGPGKLLRRDVTLTRFATTGLELAAWRQAIEQGAVSTQLVQLTLADSQLGTIARWEILDAWPSSLAVSQDGARLMETVVITNSGVRRAEP